MLLSITLMEAAAEADAAVVSFTILVGFVATDTDADTRSGIELLTFPDVVVDDDDNEDDDDVEIEALAEVELVLVFVMITMSYGVASAVTLPIFEGAV